MRGRLLTERKKENRKHFVLLGKFHLLVFFFFLWTLPKTQDMLDIQVQQEELESKNLFYSLSKLISFILLSALAGQTRMHIKSNNITHPEQLKHLLQFCHRWTFKMLKLVTSYFKQLVSYCITCEAGHMFLMHSPSFKNRKNKLTIR